MGPWGNLVSLREWGSRDPCSNRGGPIKNIYIILISNYIDDFLPCKIKRTGSDFPKF